MFKFNRSLILTAAVILLAAAPVRANGVHAEKRASGQGLSTDAFFESPTTVNGITVTPFDNLTDGTVLDIFQIPSSFTSGTPFTMTFSSIAAGYGIFDCDNANPSIQEAQSADDPPIGIGSTCTASAFGASEAFVSFNEVGDKATITFLGGAGAPPQFFFWTTPGNLLALTSATASAPEPGAFLLLACGLAGLVLLRRRIAQS